MLQFHLGAVPGHALPHLSNSYNFNSISFLLPPTCCPWQQQQQLQSLAYRTQINSFLLFYCDSWFFVSLSVRLSVPYNVASTLCFLFLFLWAFFLGFFPTCSRWPTRNCYASQPLENIAKIKTFFAAFEAEVCKEIRNSSTKVCNCWPSLSREYSVYMSVLTVCQKYLCLCLETVQK